MFRCQKCKKWLKNITTETDVVYDGTILTLGVEENKNSFRRHK